MDYIRVAAAYLPERREGGVVVAIDGDTISAVLNESQVPSGTHIVDRAADTVGPGLVDLHCHGAMGSDFADATVEDICTAARHHLACGTTTLLATVASCPTDQMLLACKSSQEARQTVPNVYGVHLEGPYFNPEWYGCHLAEMIRLPHPDEIDSLRAFRDSISLVTLAPELPGASEFIDEFARTGTVFSVGHSDATIEELKRAMGIGLSHSTHIFNAMPKAYRRGIVLEPAVLESVLLLNELTTEIIGDGIHVGPELVELVLRVKGVAQTAIVSDALRGVGMGPGEYAFGPRNGQMCQIIEDPQVGIVPGSDPLRLASSAITSADSLRILSQQTSVPLESLWEMASLVPARILKADSRIGRIAPGYAADLLFLDKDLNVSAVMKSGEFVQ